MSGSRAFAAVQVDDRADDAQGPLQGPHREEWSVRPRTPEFRGARRAAPETAMLHKQLCRNVGFAKTGQARRPRRGSNAPGSGLGYFCGSTSYAQIRAPHRSLASFLWLQPSKLSMTLSRWAK